MKKYIAFLLATCLCISAGLTVIAEDAVMSDPKPDDVMSSTSESTLVEESVSDSNEEFYMMQTKSLDLESGNISYDELRVAGSEPLKENAGEESYWEKVVREANELEMNPLEYYQQRSGQSRALLQGTRTQVSNAKVSPYSGICYLALYYKNTGGPFWGTGFWVNSNTIVTVAHNVWPTAAQGNGQLTGIKIYTGRNGAASTSLSSTENQPLSAFRITVPNAWDDNGLFPAESDYAVIKFTGATPGTHTNFTLSTSYSTATTYTLAGYPQDKGVQMWEDDGKVLGVTGAPGRVAYKMDGIGGQSGAPIFSDTKVIGFHAYEVENPTSSSYNYGTKVTNALVSMAAS